MLDPEEVEEKLRSMEDAEELDWFTDGEGLDEEFGFTVSEQADYDFEGVTVAFLGRGIEGSWAEQHETLDELLVKLEHYVYYGNNLVVHITDEELDIESFNLLSEPDSEEDQMEFV